MAKIPSLESIALTMEITYLFTAARIDADGLQMVKLREVVRRMKDETAATFPLKGIPDAIKEIMGEGWVPREDYQQAIDAIRSKD